MCRLDYVPEPLYDAPVRGACGSWESGVSWSSWPSATLASLPPPQLLRGDRRNRLVTRSGRRVAFAFVNFRYARCGLGWDSPESRIELQDAGEAGGPALTVLCTPVGGGGKGEKTWWKPCGPRDVVRGYTYS